MVALWLVLLTVGGNVLLGRELARQAEGVLRARAEVTAATVRVRSDGSVGVTELPDDAALDVGTWIFAADGRMVEAPPGSSAAVDRGAAAFAARGRGVRTTDAHRPEGLRLLALPVEGGVATVVTSTSLAPYRHVQRLAWIGSTVLGVLLLLVVHLVLRANVARALRPVRQMTEQADRWSADDVDRRFGVAPRPQELDELARTLDDLLARLAAVLRHERQLADELSHELRTPLARIQAEVDLLRNRPREPVERARALTALDEAAGSMREILETLMSAARSGTSGLPGRVPVTEVLEPLLRRAAAGRPELAVSTDVPPALVVGVDGPVLERILAPLVENALRYARGRVTLTGAGRPGAVRLLLDDDGPGVAPDHRERVFQPGWRADPADGHDGAGLGLPLARRLAMAAGGNVTVVDGATGPAFAVDLPSG